MRKLAILFISLFLLLLVLTFELGRKTQRYMDYTNPVCHSVTEDSVITDCEYRNGAWYRK